MSRIAVLLLTAVLMALVAAFPAGAQVPEPPKTPTAEGCGGSAATVDPLATKTAIDVLRSGGNAVDAAVAAAGVLGVTEPFSCGIGGGGFMVIYDAKRRRVDTIDSRETAPADLRRDAFEPYVRHRPFQAARVERPERRRARHRARLGGGAEALRHALAALAAAARRADRPRGLRRRRDVRRPGRRATRPSSTTSPRARETYLPGRRRAGRGLDPPQPGHGGHLRAHRRRPGQLLRGPDRARHRRAPCSSRRSPPTPTREVATGLDDAARPRALPRDPPRADEDRLPRPRRLRHGPAVLRRLDRRRGAQHPRGLRRAAQPREATLHRYLEASKLAYADRNAYVGDPAFVDVPLRGLLSDALRRRAARADRPDGAARASRAGRSRGSTTTATATAAASRARTTRAGRRRT